MATSTRHPWRYCGPRPAPRRTVPVPRVFQGLGKAVGFSPKLIPVLWSMLYGTDDALLEGVAAGYLLLESRATTLTPSEMLHSIQALASPRQIVRMLEVAVHQGIMRRSQANRYEQSILSGTSKLGGWADANEAYLKATDQAFQVDTLDAQQASVPLRPGDCLLRRNA